MDRGAWQATVSPWGHKESDMTEHIKPFYIQFAVFFSFTKI